MFCTVDDVEDFLQIEISEAAAVAACERAIEEATEAIRNYTHQVISQVTETITIDGKGGWKIFLPQVPVTAVTSVIENDETLTGDDDFKLGQHGILYRLNHHWSAGVQNVSVRYTHGYATIPEDIVGVATRSAARVYQAGLRSKEHNGIAGVGGLTLGDYSVTYGAEQGGGVGEGIMGVSAARVLLLSEKDILARYRYKAQ